MAVSDAQDYISQACRMLQDYENGLQSSPDVNAEADTLRTKAYGPLKAEMERAITGSQLRMGAVVTPQAIRQLLNPGLQAFLREIARPWPAVPADDLAGSVRMLDVIQDYMVANSIALESRAVTWASDPSMSPTTDGRFRRLYIGEDSRELEVGEFPETLTFRCLTGLGMGERYREQWAVYSDLANPYGVARDGSGLIDTIQMVGPDESLIDNARLNQGTKGIDGWTAGDDTLITKVSTSTYLRPRDPDATETVCRMDCSGGAGTTLAWEVAPAYTLMQRGRPLFLVVWVKPASASGSGSISLGNTTKGSQSTSGSDWIPWALDLNQGLWPVNIVGSSATVSVTIDCSGVTAGTLDFGHVGLYEMVPIRGQWWLIEAGSTPPAVNDTYSYADSLSGSDAVNQYYIQRGYGIALRSATPYTGGWTDL